MPRDLPDQPWRDRHGSFNPRGTYKILDRKLAKRRGFRDTTIWYDRFGQPNPRGTYRVINRRLTKRRGFRASRKRAPISTPTRPRWRTKTGKFNPRGTYISLGGSLVKRRGFQPSHPLHPSNLPEARAAAEPPRPGRAPPTRAPRVEKDLEATDRRGVEFHTLFRAMGTFGSDKDVYNRELIYSDIDELGIPAQFYSNQGLLLGQVRWEGVLGREELIDRLNMALQFAGERTPGFDFRDAYPIWEYKYQVVEVIGQKKRVIKVVRDGRG